MITVACDCFVHEEYSRPSGMPLYTWLSRYCTTFEEGLDYLRLWSNSRDVSGKEIMELYDLWRDRFNRPFNLDTVVNYIFG